MIEELIRRNRSYRRFCQSVPLDAETLRGLVSVARLSASASNLQPLKFILVSDPARNEQTFRRLSWAGYLKDWDGPAPGERPAAYIVVLGDTRIAKTFACDSGIYAQSILLAAAEKGLGGCIVGSVEREGLRRDLAIAPEFEICFVIALGKPAERVVLEDAPPGTDIRYWRDQDGVHHVPKRTLDELIVG